MNAAVFCHRSRCVGVGAISYLGVALVSACAHLPSREYAWEATAPRIPLPENIDSLDVHHVSWSHDGQWLAFTATSNKVIGIYVARVDGSHLRRITDESMHAAQFSLSWLPKDRGIFFLASQHDSVHFFHMLPDGSDLVVYPNTTLHAEDGAISPDGAHIAFVHTIDRRHSQIYVRAIDGTNVRPVTNTAGSFAANSNPAWSPDEAQTPF